jgi:hypothetical protein
MKKLLKDYFSDVKIYFIQEENQEKKHGIFGEEEEF